MRRLLAAVLSPKNPLFHSQTDWRIQTLVLPNRKIIYSTFQTLVFPNRKIIYSTSPGPDLATDVTPQSRSVLGGPIPRRVNASGFQELRGARARRTRRQNGADCAPPPEEHPPVESAEFRLSPP